MSTTELKTEVTAPVPEPRRRRAWVDQVLIYLLSFVLALVISAFLIAFADPDVRSALPYFFSQPMDTISAAWESVSEAYKALFSGSIINFSAYTVTDAIRPFTESLYTATSLILAGLAVALPFRAGLFNIGAQGQLILGAIVAGYIGFSWALPFPVHLLVAILGGMLAGSLWAGIAGLLKARTGAHEVIVTIMLNWIAIYLLQYLLTLDAFQRPGRDDPLSPPVAAEGRLPRILGEDFRLNLGFILALLAAWFIWWLLERSTIGFEFRAVGANPSAARTAGINVRRAVTGVMVVAGAMAGLAGMNQILGGSTEYALGNGIAGDIGFDAITVALLGRSTPLGVVLAGILMGALRAGGSTMQAATGTPIDIVLVVQSLIVLFIAAPPLVRKIFRLRAPKPE
ncbi:MAG: ABC transporter permease [Candidatus Nanopelagicales bacterium]|nr:ABC transporter permease [Candidatus Nanopelagicales bacterium]